MSEVAKGDEIRHTAFAKALLGTWALTAEGCGTKDKSNIIISDSTYNEADASCKVQWIVETAGARGPNYGVHAMCSDPLQPAKNNSTNLVIRPQSNDQILMGNSFNELRSYGRCPIE
jgi:hypothetical protein